MLVIIAAPMSPLGGVSFLFIRGSIRYIIVAYGVPMAGGATTISRGRLSRRLFFYLAANASAYLPSRSLRRHLYRAERETLTLHNASTPDFRNRLFFAADDQRRAGNARATNRK
jgi:hypothetical protein